MTGNLPPLYHNILSGLPGDPLVQDAFLWAVERPGEDRMCYRAEAFAREVHRLVSMLSDLTRIGAAAHALPTTDPDLLAFMLQRHANWRFGGNQHPPYAAR